MEIVALDGQDRSDFDCGELTLNNYIKLSASKAMKIGAATTFVGIIDEKVVGYYSLAAASILYAQMPAPAKALHHALPVPAILLGRWAVDGRFKGNGYGKHLLMDAMYRALQVSNDIGVVAFVADPLNDDAYERYKKLDFKDLMADDRKVFLSMTTIRDLFTRQ